MGTNLPHIVLQPLEGNVQYKTDDITNVNFFNYTPDAIVVRNESPFKTYQDLVAAAKAKPGALNFAGSGTNSANHAAHARLNQAAGIKTTYVAFKGTGDLHLVAPRRPRRRRDVVLVARARAEGQDAPARRRHAAAPAVLPRHADVPRAGHRLGRRRVSRHRRARSPRPRTCASASRTSSPRSAAMPEFRTQMTEQGLEIVDIPYDKMAAFMEERKKAYISSAKLLGLVK